MAALQSALDRPKSQDEPVVSIIVACEYFCCGSSFMSSVLASGPLFGRPYGGTALLISNRLVNHTVNLVANDRFTAVLVADCIVISAYMPCSGMRYRFELYSDILSELQAVIDKHTQYINCYCVPILMWKLMLHHQFLI